MSNTRVLIIGYVWPEPNSSAAGARMIQLIQCFRQQQWQVHFASAAAPTDHMADLSELGVTSHNILINDASFDQYVEQLQPHIVVFDRFVSEEQYGWRVEQQCPNALRVLDTEDLHLLRDARRQACKQSRELCQSDLFSEVAQREIAAIYRSDLALMISDYEIGLLQNDFAVPADLIHHCPFMLDVSDLSADQSPGFDDRQHFISIGNFRHAPNWDAVLYLKQTVWPLIRQQLPDAELHIYGAYPPPKATDLHNEQQGFLIKGWAADAGEVLRQSRINLAPLRFGAGIKGKLADGMVWGTPSVTTTIGVEGMTGGLPWGGAIVDDPQQFADAAAELYQNCEQWRQAQNQGFAIARAMFDKNSLGSKLIDCIQQCRGHLQQRRLNNFTGAMLRHHHHRSTQFMGQWIETKNRLAELEREIDGIQT